jgi:hypothetical protein
MPAFRRDPARERHPLDPALHAAEPASRACAWPGCDCEGEFRAPRSRDRLRDYQWLCLAHIREFNLGWDYFRGMSPDQIDAHRRDDVTWHRPTWQFGTKAQGGPETWRDPFGFFSEDGEAPRPERPMSTTQRMMRVLRLEAGFTLAELKRRYKALAKQHHPDLNDGDKAAEERLKLVIEAYRYLLDNRLYA